MEESAMRCPSVCFSRTLLSASLFELVPLTPDLPSTPAVPPVRCPFAGFSPYPLFFANGNYFIALAPRPGLPLWVP